MISTSLPENKFITYLRPKSNFFIQFKGKGSALFTNSYLFFESCQVEASVLTKIYENHDLNYQANIEKTDNSRFFLEEKLIKNFFEYVVINTFCYTAAFDFKLEDLNKRFDKKELIIMVLIKNILELFCLDMLMKDITIEKASFCNYKYFYKQIIFNLVCNFPEVKKIEKKKLNDKVNHFLIYFINQYSDEISNKSQDYRDEFFMEVFEKVKREFVQNNLLELFIDDIFRNMEESTKKNTNPQINLITDNENSKDEKSKDISMKNDQIKANKMIINSKNSQNLFDFKNLEFLYGLYEEVGSHLSLFGIREKKEMSESLKIIYNYFKEKLNTNEISKLAKLLDSCQNKKEKFNQNEFQKFEVFGFVLFEHIYNYLCYRHDKFFGKKNSCFKI
ncbi:hypothetical protein GVAV_001709 [Gurleya vavrai]